VKRIANLLHSPRWSGAVVEDFLWAQAEQHVHELHASESEAYVLWDEGVLEKPESLKAERLCAVRSSKAVRLKRIKPGYFNPPGGAPFVCLGFIGCKSSSSGCGVGPSWPISTSGPRTGRPPPHALGKN
jgi:hypothetical protein